jgi:hypothetical protein
VPEIPGDVDPETLPLGRCHCTWWRVARSAYGKQKCVGCGGTVRRLDAVDRLAFAGKLDEVTMADFKLAEREHERWANE